MPARSCGIEVGSGLETDVDAAIAACGGDMRATIRALLIANGFLTAELNDQIAAISRGYSRGPGKKQPPARKG